MKFSNKILILLLVWFISTVIYTKQASAQQTYVSFQVFYDQLSPYGQWVDYPGYGYVWIPDAGPDFVPYSSGGHWVLTDYGWAWISDYNWGWAPFHYGRWDYDSYYGWLWVPDNEWGPSWVTWRRADGYYGWEPMAPGISISVSFGSNYNSHHDHWIFVRDRDFERSDIHRYYVNRTEHDRIIRNSTVINRTHVDNTRHATYSAGPAREDVEKVTGRRVRTVAVRDNDKPGQDMNNGQLRIYRPQVRNNDDATKKTAPARVTNLKDMKRISERNTASQPRNVNTQQNTRKEQQKTTYPTNNNSKAKTSERQNVNPAGSDRNERKPNTVNPKNNNTNKAQPLQKRNEKPVNNSNERTPNTVNPQNDKINKSQPRPQQNTAPVDNTRKERKPNAVNTQKINNNNQTTPNQQKTNPAQNNRREQNSNSAKPTNTRKEQSDKPKPNQVRKRTN